MRTPTVILAAAMLVACSGSMVPTVGDEPGDQPGATLAFRPTIQADLEATGCLSQACHGSGSIAMHVTAGPADDTAWQANYDQVLAFAGTAEHSPLIDMATGVGGHVSSLARSDASVKRWEQWIAAGTPYTAVDAGPADPADAGAGGGGGKSYATDIAPLWAANGCVPCHGTAGNYSVESYQQTLGKGTDSVANVIPGDASSLLVTILAAGHGGISAADAAIVKGWVVDDQAAP